MVNIKFIYGYKIIEMSNKDNNLLRTNILLKFAETIHKDIKDLYFIYKGKELSYKNNDKILILKNENIIINIINLINKKEDNNLNQIICPKCKEMAIINFEEDNITIHNCINNHNNIYSQGEEFMKYHISMN